MTSSNNFTPPPSPLTTKVIAKAIESEKERERGSNTRIADRAEYMLTFFRIRSFVRSLAVYPFICIGMMQINIITSGLQQKKKQQQPSRIVPFTFCAFVCCRLLSTKLLFFPHFFLFYLYSADIAIPLSFVSVCVCARERERSVYKYTLYRYYYVSMLHVCMCGRVCSTAIQSD